MQFWKGAYIGIKININSDGSSSGNDGTNRGHVDGGEIPIAVRCGDWVATPIGGRREVVKDCFGLETDPFVHPKPVIVMGSKPTLLMINVLSLPVSWSAEPTTIPSKSTCSGFIVMNGVELVLKPVRVTGWVVAYPVTPLIVRRYIEVVWTPGTTWGELVLPELS